MTLKQKLAGLAAALLALLPAPASAQTAILNVSYDVSRELYKDINPAFVADWKAKTGETITVNQSHGGSSKQALSVAAGLDADVVTMNQAPDIDVLAERGAHVAVDWRQRFPHGATPYTTTTVFLVRRGNPKGIKDWSDLIRSGLQVIVPNPKTSGNARYTYLAATAFALETFNGDAEKTREFVAKLFDNVPVFDTGGRAATTTFVEREIGDVLITFEAETRGIQKEFGTDKFDIVVPSISILAEPPVAVVEKNVDKKGTRKVAEAYLKYLYSEEGQDIAGRNYYRPTDPKVAAKYASQFPQVKLFKIDDAFGGWQKASKTHFQDGGTFDQIYQK